MVKVRDQSINYDNQRLEIKTLDTYINIQYFLSIDMKFH
jgi:hypothetical protein